MISKPTLIFIVTVALSPSAIAAGSSSTSRPPSMPKAELSDYDLGVKAVKSGDYGRALGPLQKVVQADPGNADAWNYIGFAQRNLQHYDQSLGAYRKALEINPNHRGANEYLGELYLKTGDLEKAGGQLAKLQSLCPGGCSEYDDLKAAIARHQVAQKKN